MRASWLVCVVVAAAVCAGCGPLLIATGVSNATSSDSAPPDTVAPQIAITQQPQTPTNDPQPTIGFQVSDEDIASINVELLLGGVRIPIDPVDPDDGDEDGFFQYTISPPLTASGKYEFAVTAADKAMNESLRAAVDFEFDQAPPDVGKQGVLLDLRVTEVTLQAITVSWVPVADPQGRTVTYSVTWALKNASSTAGATAVDSIDATSFTILGLSPCKVYTVTLSAQDQLGNTSLGAATVDVRTDCGGVGDFCVSDDEEYFVASGAVALHAFDTAAVRIVPGDFNEDGVTDLAVLTRFARDGSDTAGTVAIHLGTGIGTGNTTEFGQNDFDLPVFDDPIIIDIAREPEAMEAGDFNNDGITDFAVGHRFSTNGITILLGNHVNGRGDGTFSATNLTTGVANPASLGVPNLNSLVVMDFNRDGIQDIVLGGEAPFVPISLLEGTDDGTGKGDGTFTAVARIRFSNLDAVSFLRASDVNNDGRAELIASGFASEQLEIYDSVDIQECLENPACQIPDASGIPTLALTPNVVTVGGSPRNVVTGDFNGDRISDLSVLFVNLPVPGSLRVLLQRDIDGDGRGDGVFERLPTIETGVAPLAINVADYNADSILDLVIGAAGQVSIYLGEGSDGIGTGTFVEAHVLPAENSIFGLATTDFASGSDPERPFGDGVLDLVTVGSSVRGGVGPSGTAVFTDNVGLPGFWVGQTEPGSIPFAAQDNIYGGQNVTFPDAAGSPSFQILIYLFDDTTGEGLFLVDLAGGLLPDAPSRFEIEGALSKIGIYLGKGGTGVADGTFQTPGNEGFDPKLEHGSALLGEGAGHVHPFDLVTEDFNGDGVLDLAVLMNSYILGNVGPVSDGFSKQLDTDGFQKPTIAIHFGKGQAARGRGVFSEPKLLVLPRVLPFAGFAPGGDGEVDADGDGDIDFDLDSRFTGRAESIATGDFNFDGIPDIVVTGGAPDTDPFSYLQIIRGDRERGEFLIGIGQAAPNDGLAITLGRFGRNAIGQAGFGLDLVMCGSKNNPPLDASNPGTARDPTPIVGAGLFRVEGSNDPDKPLGLDLTMMDSAASSLSDDKYVAVASGDFNGDTIADLAVINESLDQVEVYRGRIPSSAPGASEAAKSPFEVAPADTFAAGTTPFAIVTGDFSGDKILDLAVANRGSDNVTVFRGLGDGTFGPGTSFATDAGPSSVLAVDLNQDRILDLVTTNIDSNPSTISVLLGGGQNARGDGTFAPHPTAGRDYVTGEFLVAGEGLQTVPRPVAVVAGDFNGDGVIDLVVANQGFPTGTFADPATPFLDQAVGSLTLLFGTNTQLAD